MTIKIAVTELQKGPFLKLIFSIIRENGNQHSIVSKEFNINDFATVRFKFELKSNTYVQCGFSLMKHPTAHNSTVKMNVSCEWPEYSKRLICTENWTDWIIVGAKFHNESIDDVYSFIVAMNVVKLEPISFANLYDETDFCDFRLSTADGSGSVAVHKVCLIAHSDTFTGMLTNKWKETADGCIEIAEVTLKTLQNLKKYIYLGTLPDTEDELCQLLLLARCYLIKNLKEECITMLAQMVKPENLQKLQEFAIDSKMSELMRAIVYFTPDKTIQTAHEIELNKLAQKLKESTEYVCIEKMQLEL